MMIMTTPPTTTQQLLPQSQQQPQQEQPQEQRYTLEQKLFHALHDSQIRSPSIKEFKEAYAFCNSVRSVINSEGKRENKKKKNKKKKQQEVNDEEDKDTSNDDNTTTIDVIIDVAGGHGALGALFLIMTSAQEAIIIDPAIVGQDGVTKAWKQQFFPNKTLRYKHECLRTALPNELQTYKDKNILVVGCHACQHLSEEIIQISCEYGVKYIAVMPCCQKDQTSGTIWKRTSKTLCIPIEKLMDILLAGKVMGYRGSIGSTNNDDDVNTNSTNGNVPARPINYCYDVRMKTIDSNITPQNRIIICSYRSSSSDSDDDEELENNNNTTTTTTTTTTMAVLVGGGRNDKKINQAHEKLGRVYRKAHLCGACVVPKTTTTNTNTSSKNDDDDSSSKNKYNNGTNNSKKKKTTKRSNNPNQSRMLTTISRWRKYVTKQCHEYPALWYITAGFVAGIFTANLIGGRISNNNYNPPKKS